MLLGQIRLYGNAGTCLVETCSVLEMNHFIRFGTPIKDGDRLLHGIQVMPVYSLPEEKEDKNG